MMMIVDMTNAAKPFQDVNQDLAQIGEGIGVIIKCQREDIFNQMHRI